MPIIKCFSCGAELKKPQSHIKEKNFCNHHCYSKYKSVKWTDKNNPRWSGGNLLITCQICGKERQEKRHGLNWDNAKYCSIKCAAKDRGKNNRQENHHNWKGGKLIRTASPVRRTAKYKQWKNTVLKRDDYTCQKCFTRGGELHPHHLERLADLVEKYITENKQINVDDDYFYDLNNGQTLCKKCHRKTFKL